MHTLSEFCFDAFELRCQPLAHSASLDLKLPVPIYAAIVRKSQKVKSLWFALPVKTFGITFGESAKADEPRFVWVQFQFKLSKSVAQLLLKTARIGLVLEADDKIIGPANDNDITTSVSLSPLLHPKVECIMQIHICHQR